MRILLAAALGTLALAVPASAATVYWTPGQMARLAPTLPGPLVVPDTGGGSTLSRIAGTPSCVGIGTARAGAFPGFRCSVSWTRGFLQKGTGTLWVRPTVRSYCISSFGLASCPASPRPDDPRVCDARYRYAEYCVLRAARKATDRAVRAAGRLAVNLACVPRSTLVVRCDWGGGVATVSFALGDAWKTSVALGSS